MLINESYHISSIQSLRKFTLANYRLLKLAWSRATKSGKKIKTVAWTLNFNTWTLCICISARVGICEMFIVLISVLKILVEKNDISGYIWHRSCTQMAKYSFLDEKIVYQSFYDAPLTFSSFSSRKISVFRHASASRLRSVYCLKILVEKMISPVLFDTKIVHSNDKMLFFQPKDYLRRAALVELFFLQGKVCVLYPCAGKSLARCLSFEAFWRPCRKNDISAHIWHKPFIQTVKYSSFNQRIVYQSFYGALLTLNYFFFKEKFVL